MKLIINSPGQKMPLNPHLKNPENGLMMTIDMKLYGLMEPTFPYKIHAKMTIKFHFNK